uniref:Uncharacterized protein n=1 Tax=Anguilla anguilla TaxID=7936 RepID=A0A0E9TY46_ANGAN
MLSAMANAAKMVELPTKNLFFLQAFPVDRMEADYSEGNS